MRMPRAHIIFVYKQTVHMKWFTSGDETKLYIQLGKCIRVLHVDSLTVAIH
jgi:hypothetical protein